MARVSDVVVVERDERVAVLTLDRPQQLNAIGAAMLEQLDRALETLRDDPRIGALVIAGAGRAFSAGADIAEFGALTRAAEFRAWIERISDTCDRIERFPKPVVAAVDGAALGGGFELVLACDLRVASARARFGLPEVKLGLLPGAGGAQRLARQVPVTVARHMLLTGEPIPAAEAFRLGLVNQVVADGDALTSASALARSLADGPAAALAAAKRLLGDGLDRALDEAVRLERESIARLFETADAREGVQAFLDKRPPRFGAQRGT
jgi:enoyl-CoA hydratase